MLHVMFDTTITEDLSKLYTIEVFVLSLLEIENICYRSGRPET